MDGTPVLFAGAATATVAIASTMSKASLMYKIAVVAAGAAATYGSYTLTLQKKRKNAYLLAVLAIVIALVALNYYTKCDRAHFADLIRKIN
jgi:hypothetical protein